MPVIREKLVLETEDSNQDDEQTISVKKDGYVLAICHIPSGDLALSQDLASIMWLAHFTLASEQGWPLFGGGLYVIFLIVPIWGWVG